MQKERSSIDSSKAIIRIKNSCRFDDITTMMHATRTEPNILRMSAPVSPTDAEMHITSSQSLKNFSEVSNKDGQKLIPTPGLSLPAPSPVQPKVQTPSPTAPSGGEEKSIKEKGRPTTTHARRPRRWKSISTFRNAFSALTYSKR